MAQQRLVDLITPFGDDVLRFERATGTETLGRLFEYEIFGLSEKNTLDFDAILGKHVTMKLELPGGAVRHIDARVAQFGLVGASGRFHRYRIVARPWTWMLTRTSDCRIFQEKTVPEIIEDVFADHSDVHFKLGLSGTYVKRDYCVQYRETDFDFVSRLMEEEGIYYYFRHEPGKHTLMLSDEVNAHASIGSVGFLPHERGARDGQEYIREWRVSREIQAGATALTDYDFEKPSVDLLVSRTQQRGHAEAAHEIFDYPGEYVARGDGEPLVRIRLEERQAQHETIEGVGNSRALACGALFALTGFARADQNREYLIVSTRIEAIDNAFESGADAAASYRCDFQLIPRKEPFRTARSTPRPIVRGPQTAVVVGPPGEEIFVDQYGRVKCQFFWDRYGQSDDKSSCWIRVSQIWAGKQWGWMTVPRIGQEVIVSFLEGNPDNPIITGRVYNADQMPPWALPANKTQSGILTRSSKGGSPANANELRFEDKKGEEQVFLHAEKNQDIEVENDETHWVGHDRTKTIDHDEIVHVQHDRTETVGNNETISVGVDRTEDVGNNETISIVKNRTEDVGGNESVTVSGTRSITVTKDQTHALQANDSITVAKNATLEVGETRKTQIGKDDNAKVGKNYLLDAGDQITLKTGSASLVMKKDGTITLSGKDITITGSGKIGVKASSDLVLKGAKIAGN